MKSQLVKQNRIKILEKLLTDTLQRNSSAIIVGLLVFFVLSCSILISPLKSFWSDEVYSINFARNLGHSSRYIDTNMLFYHSLLHVWLKLGNSEIIVRLLSTIFSCATIPVVYLIARKLFNKSTGLIASTLISFNAFFIAYSEEARSYSLFLLLSSLSIYFFIRILKEPSKIINYIFYTLATCLAIYSHYFTYFLIFTQICFLLLFVRKTINKKYLFLTSFVFLFVTIHVFLLSSLNAAQINWIPRPGLLNMAGFPFVISGDFPFTFIVSSMLLIYLAFSVLKRVNKLTPNKEILFNYILLIILFLVPSVLAFSISFFVKPIVTSKYLIYCIIPSVILVSRGLDLVSNKIIKCGILVMLIVFSTIRLFGWYANVELLHWGMSNQKDDWRKIVSFTNNNVKSTDAITFLTYYYEDPFLFYNNQIGGKENIIDITNNSRKSHKDISIQKTNNLIVSSFDIKFPRIWLIADNSSTEQIKKIRNVDKYNLVHVYNFGRVEIFLYAIRYEK